MYFKTLLIFCAVQIIQYSYGQQIFIQNDTYLRTTDSLYHVHTSSNTWLEAKRICADEGARLFFPENLNERDTVFSYLKGTRNFEIMHVGLTDMVSEGVFETTDGKGLYDLPHKWRPGEPNNANEGENCVEMLSDGSMNDISCKKNLELFICKSAFASLQWNQPCNIAYLDYDYHKTLGRCYKFHTKPVTWTEAHALCAMEQSYLAVINSQQEADYLVELTEEKNKNNGITEDYVKDTVFLGFHNLFDGVWTTVKGTSVENSGYDSWGPGQPDDGDRDKCGSMFYDGQLNDIACYKKSFFICEHEITTPR